jgi:pyruvate dehydrogenase E1 component alpha subunit
MTALTPDDSVVASYREHGHAVLRGVSTASLMAEMFGKATGCAHGHGGSMHLFCAAQHFFGGYAIVGGGLPIAVGLALADQMQKRSRVTACFFGDGATDEGEFHEALNLAALWQLPVLFLCENNQYSMGTALLRHRADPVIAHQPPVYGIPAEQVDGMDVLAVEEATRRNADAVRQGDGPRFIEFKTYRFRAHSMYDVDRYRSKAEVEHWKQRDPITLFVQRLEGEGALTEAQRAVLEMETRAEVEDAVRQAEAAPFESLEELTRHVYAREHS